MTYKLYYDLIRDAAEAPDADTFIAEYGWADWMDDYGGDADRLVSDLRNIYDVANMSVKDMLAACGTTKAAIAERFGIPLRTIHGWANASRECPKYIMLMMAELLGMITVTRK